MPVFELSFLHPRFWLIWFGLMLFFLFSLLPLSLINTVGEKLGEYAARKNKKRFNIAKVNLSLCFPEKTEAEIEAMVLEHFRTYIRSLMHYGLLWWAPESRLNKYIDVEGFEKIDQLLEQKKNIILLTCHSAGLEFTGIALSMRHACSGPYKPMRNKLINWLVAQGRGRLGTITYTREEGFRPLIRDTRKGRLLIYLADEDLGSDVSVFAPFFGVQKATISVLGRLAKSCDAVVLPCIGCYDKERSKYVVKLLPQMENFPCGNEVDDAATMNKVVEEMICQCKTQYFWNLRLFQTRPEGEASVYE
ncbi:MAG: lysophospholipid acyltransferase family protein [Gammaproteobacteria bacterium]|nr:lysophospholipid acyltransferase family protein [Gammaproteobacteria bacterium]MCW8922686.1 lysophospholipid acyltransferase family protein [Gammaproteobacteria bacterium]